MFTLNTRDVREMSEHEIRAEMAEIQPIIGKAFADLGADYTGEITVFEGSQKQRSEMVALATTRLEALGKALDGLKIAPGQRIAPEDSERKQISAVLAPDQKMADRLPRGERLSLAKYLHGIASGDWNGAAAEQKVMSEGVLGSGGDAVPSILSAQIIDRARALATVFRAGAQTVPMTSNTLRIARVSGDPTAAWKAENATATASDVSLEAVDFQARTLVALVKMSVELADDSPNAEAIVENAIAQALALELDRVALRGSGAAPEPEGIRNATGVDVIDLGANGAAPAYSDFSQAVEAVETANHEPGAVIYHPRTGGTLDRLVDTTGQPLRAPASFDRLRKFSTTQIPINLTHGTATNASEAYVGGFANVMIGVRTSLGIEVSRVAADATNSAFADYQIWVRAVLRADVQLAHAAAFSVITGIIPAAA